MKVAEFKQKYIKELMPRFDEEKRRGSDGDLAVLVADLERMILQLEDGCGGCGGALTSPYPAWRGIWGPVVGPSDVLDYPAKFWVAYGG